MIAVPVDHASALASIAAAAMATARINRSTVDPGAIPPKWSCLPLEFAMR